MNIKKYIGLLLISFIGSIGYSQSNYQLGLLPAINVNTKLNDDLKLNFKTGYRHIYYYEQSFDPKHELVDLSTIISTKIGLNNSLAGGYLFRFRDGKPVHRLIQQYTINQEKTLFRVGHRLSSDQTLEEDIITYRLRYRVSGQMPLKGQTLNPKEFYLKLSNEYLNIFKAGEYDLEIRIAAAIGYEFNDDNKLEIGIENRSDSFVTDKIANDTWVTVGWYLSI